MFELITTDKKARRGRFHTPDGTIETPVFMNVGTQAAIKGGVSTEDLEKVKCQIQLSNTYHLHVRPGDELIWDMGGLHKFMNWDKPILTDSGGFQVFSLAKLRTIKEEGVYFASHVDGRKIFMSPEVSMQIQANLGSTIAMAFDECVENPSTHEYVEKSSAMTIRWLERCKNEIARLNEERGAHQMLFGINQGGVYKDIRIDNMKRTAGFDLDGYAIGGLAVGEPPEVMYSVIESVEPYMPHDKPRYLMGVGKPENILEAVERGIDFFDCVMPTRNARHSHVFTSVGVLNLMNAQYERDSRPLQEGCGCEACQRYSRAYIRHLFKVGEMLAGRLCVLHNLYFYNTLMEQIREAIAEQRFAEFKAAFLQAQAAAKYY